MRRCGRDGNGALDGGVGQALQHGVQKAGADGLGQHVGDAVQKGFLLPGGLAGGGVNDDRRPDIQAAKPVHGPDEFHVHQIRVQQAYRDQSMRQQRFSLVHRQAVNDPILIRTQPRANNLGEIGMIGQN